MLRRLQSISTQFLSTTPQYFNSHNHFNYFTKSLPHPDKVHKGGEDALFVHPLLLSVADGVGGWAEHGVDPAKYSKELCTNIGKLFNSNNNKYINNPKLLIKEAHTVTKEIGSTTCVIVTIDQQKNLIYATNIGDSGYMIIRIEDKQSRIIHKSVEQQKSFNFPYQIGSQGDDPSEAQEFTHQIQNGDIVLLGTDGFFDNLSQDQIDVILKDHLKKNSQLELQKLIDELGSIAYKLSLDEQYVSPFAKDALKAGYRYEGGKSDDITIIIAQCIVKQS